MSTFGEILQAANIRNYQPPKSTGFVNLQTHNLLFCGIIAIADYKT